MNGVRAAAAFALAMLGCSGDGGDHSSNTSDASSAWDASGDAGAATTEAGALRDICDGSEEIRFALRLVGGGPQIAPPMMTSIGFSYLYVLGDCRYWVNPAVYYQWEETRTGVLSRAQEQALSRTFDYAAWKDLAGYHLGNAGGLPVGVLQAFDGESLISCDNSCISYGASLGEALDLFSENFKEWSKNLWASGAPSEATLQVLAERFEVSEPPTEEDLHELYIQWPFAWSIDDLVADREGAGRLLTDEARVRELRALRSMYVGKRPLPDGKPNPFLRVSYFAFLVGDDLNLQYILWFRDALPFETNEGKIPFLTTAEQQ